jgi:hypothetical protein
MTSTGAEKVFELQRMPPMGVEILRSALARTRLRRSDRKPERLEVRLVLARIDTRRLAAYRAVCGLPSDARLPILYPQVLATPLHLHLMTLREFPFRAGGLIHVANVVEQTRPLDAGEALGLCARIGGVSRTARGAEFEIITECSDAHGAIPWRASMTLLQPISAAAEAQAPAPPAARLARYRSIEVPADISRCYAQATWDFDPLHLPWLAARMLGRRRPVAPALWLAAHCMAQLPAPRGGWRECRLSFHRPLAVPAHTVLRCSERAAGLDCLLLDGGGMPVLHARLD